MITAAMTFVAAQLGSRYRALSARRAGIFGGVILIGLGCKILLEHLSAG